MTEYIRTYTIDAHENPENRSESGPPRPVKGAFATEIAYSEAPASAFGVIRVDPTLDVEWDPDIASCEGATFFHSSSWARVLRDTYGFKPVYFVCRQQGRIQALLPMMDVNSGLTGRRGVSLPFTDECASICADTYTFKELYQEALKYAKIRKWKYVECRGGISLFAGAIPSASYTGHRLDLRIGESALFSRCDSSVRRAIRKSELSGVSVEFSRDFASVRDFHGLLCKTRRRHGVPPQPLEFFANIHRHVLASEKGWVVLAKAGHVPVAGAIYFHFGKTAIYKFGASDDSFQHLRPNNLVMWEAIKHYASEGFEVFDLGRTSTTNVGLQKFKRSWGTVEHRIEYTRQVCRTGEFVAVGDKASGFPMRLMKKLPNPLFKLIGSILYKHMA